MIETAVDYHEMRESYRYYLDHTDPSQVGRFRAWFHRSRFRHLGELVKSFYAPGDRIADLGCGNCLWNDSRLPVVGVDLNQKMLGWARDHGYLSEYHVCADLRTSGLGADLFDIVVMSETLEHLSGLAAVLAEVRRIMKDDGEFLITVPYDFFLSPFYTLFNLHCVYQAYVKGSRYHRLRCGHIHHFSKRRLRSLLLDNGFRVDRLFTPNGLTLMAAAAKSDTAAGVRRRRI